MTRPLNDRSRRSARWRADRTASQGDVQQRSVAAAQSRWVCCLVLLGCALVAPPALHADEAPRWQASASFSLGYPGGYVQVGENQYAGDRLSFHRDLGVDLLEMVNLDVGYHFTPRDSFHAALQMFFLDGSTTLP